MLLLVVTDADKVVLVDDVVVAIVFAFVDGENVDNVDVAVVFLLCNIWYGLVHSPKT